MKVTTETGVVLDTEDGWAESATQYARSKGFKDIVVVVATHLDKTRNYLIIQNNQPIAEDTTYEGICCYIDFMWMSRDIK